MSNFWFRAAQSHALEASRLLGSEYLGLLPVRKHLGDRNMGNYVCEIDGYLPIDFRFCDKGSESNFNCHAGRRLRTTTWNGNPSMEDLLQAMEICGEREKEKWTNSKGE